MEQVCIETIESGIMTKDLAGAIHGTANPDRATWVTTREFLDHISAGLRKKLEA
jgi:isocitrate dehydrogenase